MLTCYSSEEEGPRSQARAPRQAHKDLAGRHRCQPVAGSTGALRRQGRQPGMCYPLLRGRSRAPAAACAPSISTCSTCKGDQLTGPSVRLLGPRPATPLRHHPLQELACLEGSSPKMLEPRETWTSQDCPRWTSEAGGNLGS